MAARGAARVALLNNCVCVLVDTANTMVALRAARQRPRPWGHLLCGRWAAGQLGGWAARCLLHKVVAGSGGQFSSYVGSVSIYQ